MATRTHHLVGREDELDTVVGRLDDHGRLPQVTMLCGEAGIGKTSLWLAGIEHAADRGYHVLRTRPNEAETGYSYAGLTDLLGEAVEGILPQLPPIQRRALETALLLGDAELAVDERAVASAFLGALRVLARDEPVLVAVDDIQWLDGATLAALRFALPRLEDEPVAALFAVRGTTPDWVQRAVLEDRLLILDVAGLSLGAVHELLRERLAIRLSRPAAVRIHETSAGNPFYALELARALERHGGRLDPAGDLPLSPPLVDLVARRLDALSPEALGVARVAATAADPTAELVEAIVGGAAETGLGACIAAGVLELDGTTVRLAHPLLGTAIRSKATDAELRAVHARLAELAATAEERARHLALSTSEPDEEVATLLDREAADALRRGATATAAELAEQALRLTPPARTDAVRDRVLVAADRLYEAGDDEHAIALLEEALAAAPTGVDRGRVLMHLGATRYDTVGPHEAGALYRQALDEANGDPGLETEVNLRLAELARFTSDREAGLEHARLAVETSAQLDEPRSRCRALAAYGLMHFTVGLGVPRAQMDEALALERALGIETLGDEKPTDVVVHQLFWSGDLDGARRLLLPRLEATMARADPGALTHLWFLALVEWRAGNWPLAVRYADDNETLQRQTGREAMWPVTAYPGAIVAAHQGMVENTRARSGRALEAAEATRQTTVAVATHRSVLGFLDLSLGDVEAAVSHLRASAAIKDAGRLLEPGQRTEIGDLVEALIAIGEDAEAEATLATWEERSRRLDRAWALAFLARGRGLLLAARGELEAAFSSFDDALAQHARSTDPFQHARTLLALGATQRRAKQRAAARTTLTDALERFERIGAPLWAEKARAELARIGGRRSSPGELTEAEQRIAQLVAQGKTNREVAAALFLTVHSVETALTRIYRKLGVRSRAELTSTYSANS